MTHRRALRRVLLAIAVALGGTTAASAWLTAGHARVAADAVRLLPRDVPGFFRNRPQEVGQSAVDPDYWKIRDAPALGDAERPRHYLDVERLDGEPLPATRSEYLRLLAAKKLEVSQVGLLPYSIVESFEKLELCFAQWRRRAADRGVEAKCRVFAGELAHYAGDLEQPLHTTIHHDGRALPDGESPRTGLHKKVDGLFTNARFDAAAALRGVAPRLLPDVWQTVLVQFAQSHALVDQVYAFEAKLFAEDGGATDPAVVGFTAERYRATAELLSSLFLTAWERSKGVEVPSWAVP